MINNENEKGLIDIIGNYFFGRKIFNDLNDYFIFGFFLGKNIAKFNSNLNNMVVESMIQIFNEKKNLFHDNFANLVTEFSKSSDNLFKKLNDNDFGNMLNNFSIIDNNNYTNCLFCSEEYNMAGPSNYFPKCGCILHKKCFEKYVEINVNENTLPIHCPSCNNDIEPNTIEECLKNIDPSHQLLKKYEKFNLEKLLINNKDEFSCCPTPGCEYIFFFDGSDPHFKCPLCNKDYCIKCQDEWHTGVNCDQYKKSKDVNLLDKQFIDFINGTHFKMCPFCKAWVEKTTGCDHMTCKCGKEFCYKCGEGYVDRKHNCKK